MSCRLVRSLKPEILPKRSDIDLVISEWKLRSMDGSQFVQYVRDHGHLITLSSFIVPWCQADMMNFLVK